MDILLYFLLLVLGLVLITIGADVLTNGAVIIAERLGVSQLVIGLTIVGLGTSAPELVVSITSALANKPDIAIANVIGSNITNIFLILGLSAIIYPLRVSHYVMKRDIPVVLLVTVVCLVMASDRLLAGALVENIIDRGEGIILLCMLLFYLYFAFLSARREDTLDVAAIQQEDAAVGADVTPKQSITTLLLSLVKLIGGLALLIIGGRLFVSNASEIARSWGVSEAIIGLTIVAIGTSLPELATSVVAAIKRQPDLAMGNIVGSNIFNILFILGSSATITPLVPSGIHFIDYIMMLVAVFLLFIFSNLLGRATISRQEGVILLSIYVAYMIYLVCQVL
jgi:K+-dependent Na+/Ca+ exchanger family protein